MAIVTLLMLSHDAAVCDALHRIKVGGIVLCISIMTHFASKNGKTVCQIKEVLWFKERRLLNISVGR
jgi:hypothetical protein